MIFKGRMLGALAPLGLLTLVVAAPVQAQTVTQVMSGLDNPRGLAFGPEGGLYVAEAGRGGDGPSAVIRGAVYRYGASGAVTRWWKGVQERVATGLPSIFAAATGECTGPHGLSFQGVGGLKVAIGLGTDPAVRANFGADGALLGTLVQVAASGRWRVVADVAAHEAAENPAGGPVDSNPYGVLSLPGETLVADAGANALLRVGANGAVSTVAVFPARPVRTTDAVPTAVALGPDGAFYVGELTGVPFAAGAARIYRVVPGNAPEIVHTGFKTIIDLKFGADGSLYVLQHASSPVFFGGSGQIVRIAPDGSRQTLVGGPSQISLNRPTSLEIGPDGALYVTNNGVSVGGGEVLRIDL